MRETVHFGNDGYGWSCKSCRESERFDSHAGLSRAPLPRFFREGEAEEREARLFAQSLARWKDDSRCTLVCPRCGVEERVSE